MSRDLRADLRAQIDSGAWDLLLERFLQRRDLENEHDARWLGAALAAHAPAQCAAQLLHGDNQEGAFGPIWELVALTRPWADLAPHAPRNRAGHLAAYTRVLAGEAAGWDVARNMPHYTERGGSPVGRTNFYCGERAPTVLPVSAAHLVDPDPEADAALRELDGEGGDTETVIVNGTALDAAAALQFGYQNIVNGAFVAPSAAYYHLLYAAAGSGPYQKSRGAAMGRVRLWRMLAVLACVDVRYLEQSTTEINNLVDRTRWFGWAEPDVDPNYDLWFVQLAIEDPVQGRSWGFSGTAMD